VALDPAITSSVMQRLFSAFPNSWPGAGLLVLRVAAATPLLLGSIPFLEISGDIRFLWFRIAAAICSALLLTGTWTPVAGAAQVILELLLAVLGASPGETHLTQAAIGVSLCFLGPGAWSIDARLYGHKHIDL
jgi:putative oxidoreductase